MILKRIFKGEVSENDEELHNEFIKFSRGEFKNKYLIEAKKQAKNWAIKTGAEFANFFVKKCLESSNEEKFQIKGVIVSTLDLSEEINFEIEKTKNFQGVRQLVVNTEVNSKDILNLMEKYPRIFFALSFSTQDYQLKIKAKPPKSGKPSKKDGDAGKPKADFCNLKTNNSKILNDLFFDLPGFENSKEIFINHTININEIIYPKDLKEMKPEEIREKSKRKGIIVREIEVDEKKTKSEHEFNA